MFKFLLVLFYILYLVGIQPALSCKTYKYGVDERDILVLGGASPDPPQDMQTLYETFPVYRTIGKNFAKSKYAEIGPKGLLYVQQKELAAAHPSDDNVEIIGSDDATSCIVAVLRHSGSGAAAVGHFDGSGGLKGAQTMAGKVSRLTPDPDAGRFELSLIGGVLEDTRTADTVFTDVLSGFSKLEIEVDLVLAFIGELNTHHIGRADKKKPLFYGAGVNLKTGEIFPATFPDKGPEIELRVTRVIAGRLMMLDVYNNENGMLKIGPFDYDTNEKDIKGLLKLDDETLLQTMSTTPNMEPPQYIEQIKAALKFQLDNPDPMKSIFKDNEPHYFQRNPEGLWLEKITSNPKKCWFLFKALNFFFPGCCC